MKFCHNETVLAGMHTSMPIPMDSPKYEADPDIAGIGVSVPLCLMYIFARKQSRLTSPQIICAFVATNYITLCLGLAKLVLTATSDTDQTRIDVSIFKLLRHPALFQVTDECRNLWSQSLRR